MKKMLCCVITAFGFFIQSISVSGADTYVKREFRSAWVATVWCLDWPSKTGTSSSVISSQRTQMTNYLDQLKADNFNAVFFQVRSMCDAMYKSSYEPWSSYLTGTRGKEPGWDPLDFVVTECHKRGMECHAWVNPYRWATSASGWSTAQDQELKDAGLLLSHVATGSDGSQTTTTILNPALKETNQRIVNVCREIITNYDVDGIVFDDYFYPSGIPVTSAAGDYALWQNSGTSKSFADWRRSNVNQMVADVYNMIQSENPAVRFGISPAGVACSSASVAATHGISPCPKGSDWQYAGIFSDPVQWLQDGTIDYISPQIYWRTDHSTNPFGPITQWWSTVAKKFGRHHYASHSISALGSASNNNRDYWDNYGQQIQYSRDYTENDAPGAVFYSVAYLNGSKASGLGDYLLKNKFQHHALTPAIDWKARHNYGKVTNLHISSNNLVWDDCGYVKYAVYAIPDAVSDVKAESSSAGGILADYLMGVTYTNSFAIALAYKSGYHFAVSIVDFFGNEYAPRYTIEEVSYAPKTHLLSPGSGGRIYGDFNLEWEKVDADGYRLEIYSDKTLANLVYSASSGWTDDNDVLGYPALYEDFSNGTYYWRVVTNKAGCEDVSSEVYSFDIITYEIEEGYVRQRDVNMYDNIDGMKLESRWERSVKEGFGNISFVSSGTYSKGFCVVNDTIYVCGRSANSSKAKCYLDKYDATSGAYYGRMNLNDVIQGNTYPCNDVIKDDAGNVLVYNYTMRMSTNPVKLYKIDKQTGDAVLIATCTTSKTNRVENCKVTGDVNTGCFTVYAAVTSGNIIAKWNVADGVVTEDTEATLAEFTSGATKLGAGPRVFPVGDDKVVVNSSSTVPALYQYSTGQLLSTFGEDTEVIPSSTKAIATNGFASFECGEKRFAIFPATDYSGVNGYTFSIVQTSKDMDFENMKLLWTVPGDGIGSINNSNNNALVDYELTASADTAKIYLYVPGNGLCSYRMTGIATAGIIPVKTAQETIDIAYRGNSVNLSVIADDVWIYSVSGVLMAHSRNTSDIYVGNLAKGTYIFKIRSGRLSLSRKISLR